MTILARSERSIEEDQSWGRLMAAPWSSGSAAPTWRMIDDDLEDDDIFDDEDEDDFDDDFFDDEDDEDFDDEDDDFVGDEDDDL